MSQNLYHIANGLQFGSALYFRPPIFGMMGQFCISLYVGDILDIGFKSTLFNSDRCDAFSGFVERNYSLIQYTPLIIGAINEAVPEQYLESVEKVNDLYSRMVQVLWFTAVGWGLAQSIRYRLRPQTCFYTAAVAGSIFRELYRLEYLSENNFKRIYKVICYSKLALGIYLDTNGEYKESLVTYYVLSKIISFISSSFQSDRVEHYKELFVRYFIASRQMRQAGLFVDPMTHLVDSFDTEAVDAGTKFLREKIYRNLSAVEQKSFKEMDPGIIYYILSRAVYIYIFGEKNVQEIPEFFKENTRNNIAQLRGENIDEEAKKWLAEHFNSLENFDKNTPEKFQHIRTAIVNQGVLEGRGGMLVLKCWAEVSAT